MPTDEEATHRRREHQLLRMCSELPALRVRVEPDSLPFFLGSDVRKLWGQQTALTDVLFELGSEQVEAVWEDALLFITFLVYIEAPPSFYSHLSSRLCAHGDRTLCYRDAELPYSRDRLAGLGLSAAKSAKWEDQLLFTPATIVFNSQKQWLQRIPDKLTRLPFVHYDETREHGGYGDVRFINIAPEYVIDENPRRRRWNSDEPIVVAVKSFHAREDGLAEAENMQLLKRGLARNHSISLHEAIIEHGQGTNSSFLIIFPRAELGDLGQFLRGGRRDDTQGEKQLYDFDKTFPHASGDNLGHRNLAHALLEQCGKLASALVFLHVGFSSNNRWVRCAHMDLKPNNIIIFGGDGAVGRWKFCDFGISVFKDEGALDEDDSSMGSVWDYYAHLTMNTDARRGGGQYQAPEIHESWETPFDSSRTTNDGHERVGRSSDVWSFGCIFAEVLAFALGGPQYVREFHAARKQKSRGIQYDHFYSAHPCGNLGLGPALAQRFVVRPQVLQWLDQHCRADSSSLVWMSCWAGHVKKILQVDPAERPNAQALESFVLHVRSDALRRCSQLSAECSLLGYLADDPGQPSLPEQTMDIVTESAFPTIRERVSHQSRSSDASTAAATTTAAFLVPVSSNPLFTGRAKIIQRMKDFYFGESPGQKRLVLTGLGGVGKTQIAAAFAYEAYANSDYSTVLWVFADDEQELLKSFSQIARTLGLYPEVAAESAESKEGLSARMPPLAVALLQWLSREPPYRWLLVFDNVDDLDSFDVSEFFPKVPWGDILVTSRRKQASRLGYPIAVDVMDEDEAVELLYRCSRLPAAHDGVVGRCLVEALGYLPLAVDQAGAYISEQCIDFVDYMELYMEGREHLLRHKPPKAVWSYEETVFTTWEISYAAVSQSDSLAAKLLNLVAFFHSDSVPLALLCNLSQPLQPDQRLLLKDFLDFIKTRSDYSQLAGPLCDELMTSKLKISQAIGRLTSFSLVDQKTQTHSISTHPLVHFWLRERQAEAARVENARAAICLVLHALINAYDTSQFANAEIIYPYLFICLDHVHTIPNVLSDTELHKIGACIVAIDSWVPLSLDPGTLHRADRFYDLIVRRQAGAEWRIREPMLAIRRALRLKSMGQRRECSEHCARYLETFEQRTRFDKTYVACMARTSAPCFYRVGDYDGAENVYGLIDDSLDSSGAMLARKQLVLGAIKIDRGLPLEAETLLIECAGELLRGIGQEHFLLRVWYQLMATCYISLGRYADAEDTILKGLKERLDLLNVGKIEFSFSDYELCEVYARILREQQRYEEGRTFLSDLLKKTSSQRPRPARSLAELSMILVELDEATYPFKDCAPSLRNEERRWIDTLTSRAHATFEAATAAYELEWNRGTWVFKIFPAIMEQLGRRLKSSE